MVHHHPSSNILIKMLDYQGCSTHGNNHNLLQENRVIDKPPFFFFLLINNVRILLIIERLPSRVHWGCTMGAQTTIFYKDRKYTSCISTNRKETLTTRGTKTFYEPV